MSEFVFNQAGLEALVRGPAVRREVERLARRTAVVAELNISEIIQNPRVEPRVLHSMQGDSSAIVGLVDEGRVARYLDEKAKREFRSGTRGDWMRNALLFTFPD